MGKKLLIILFYLCSFCTIICAQENEKQMIILKNGTSVTGNVEAMVDGGYKVTTSEGDVFFFSNHEVDSIRSVATGKTIVKNNDDIVPRLKYSQYKRMYNPKEYQPSPYDKYNPALVGVLSFFIPGLGNYMVGQVGTGVFCTIGAVSGVALSIPGIGDEISSIVGSALVLTSGIISTITSIKGAKITNMYYQDLAKMASVQYSFKPMLALNTNPLSSIPSPVYGLSLSILF